MYRDLNDYEILYLVKENDDDNYDIILEKYRPLINKIVSKYLTIARRYSLEYDDLYQIASMVLFNAIKNYSMNRGNLFYTYLNRSIEYGIIAELRKNNTKKMNILNYSISYDQEIPSTELNYIDIIPDPKSKVSFCDKLISNYDLIIFKNILSFDNACIFEMLYNGYLNDEISILLNIDIKLLKRKIKSIKDQLIYI